jgi:hypothetical protein
LEVNGTFDEISAGPFGYAHTDAGTIPAVPVTSGQTIELRTWQDQGGNMTVAFRWGIRLHGGV